MKYPRASRRRLREDDERDAAEKLAPGPPATTPAPGATFLTAAVRRCKLTRMKSLGERIRELRDEKDLSLRELCKKAGDISPAFLSDIELGRRHPSEEVLRAIAKALSANLDELKHHDTRPAVDEIKRRTLQDPKFGFAFRRILDENVTPEELLKLANDKAKGNKK
jgi:transcriptional regulator with XRE-family HTH domain